MPVSFDTFHHAGRQQVLRRGAIKDLFFWIGDIWETRACTHVKADGRLFYIDVKIVRCMRQFSLTENKAGAGTISNMNHVVAIRLFGKNVSVPSPFDVVFHKGSNCLPSLLHRVALCN
jgi:hypothetical protein